MDFKHEISGHLHMREYPRDTYLMSRDENARDNPRDNPATITRAVMAERGGVPMICAQVSVPKTVSVPRNIDPRLVGIPNLPVPRSTVRLVSEAPVIERVMIDLYGVFSDELVSGGCLFVDFIGVKYASISNALNALSAYPVGRRAGLCCMAWKRRHLGTNAQAFDAHYLLGMAGLLSVGGAPTDDIGRCLKAVTRLL